MKPSLIPEELLYRIARLIAEAANHYVHGSGWREPTYDSVQQAFMLHFGYKGEQVDIPLNIAELRIHEQEDSICAYRIGMKYNEVLEARGIDWRNDVRGTL